MGGAGELAGGIDEFLQMTAVERRRIGDAGRQRIIEEFSLERMVGRFERLWDDVLGLAPRQDQQITEQAA